MVPSHPGGLPAHERLIRLPGLGHPTLAASDPVRFSLRAGVVAASAVVVMWAVDDLTSRPTSGSAINAVGEVCAALLLLSMLLSRRFRTPVALVLGAGLLGSTFLVHDPAAQPLSWALIAMVTVTLALAYGAQWILLALWVLVSITWGVTLERGDPDGLRGFTVQAVVPGVLLMSALGGSIGLVVRRRRSAEARVALLEDRRRQERMTLARELHDNVARDLTIIAMQAAVLRSTTDADELEVSREAIEQTARSGLDALKRLLVVLRADDAVESPEFLRDPRAESLRDATSQAVRHLASLGFQVTASEMPGGLLEAAERGAVRVIHEGVVNITKHAPPGAVCGIDVAAVGDDLVVSVTNEFDAGVASRVPSTQIGLESLRERIRLLGGRLTSGPEDGRWVLQAHIPQTPPLAGTVRSGA